ncbi:MAG: hypothetical protein AAF497_10740 [Planctomycetota bacterium]
MREFLGTPSAQAVIWSAVALMMCLGAWYLVKEMRDGTSNDDSDVDHLAYFKEMRQQGVLDPGEFRTIKTSLGEKIRDRIREENKSH